MLQLIVVLGLVAGIVYMLTGGGKSDSGFEFWGDTTESKAATAIIIILVILAIVFLIAKRRR